MQENIIKENLKQIFELFNIKILDFELDKIIKMTNTNDWYRLEKSKEVDALLNKSCKGRMKYEVKVIYLSSIYKDERDRESTLIHEKLHAILYEIGIEEFGDEELIDRLVSVFID